MKAKIADEAYIIFFTSISGYAKIATFWDHKLRTCNFTELFRALPTLSKREQVMARFYLSVWVGENYGFDIINDILFINKDDIGNIIDWLIRPYLLQHALPPVFNKGVFKNFQEGNNADRHD